jgi:rod shape-determining protein MreD
MVLVLLGASLAQVLLPGWSWLGQAKFPFLLSAVLYYALNHRPGVTVAAAFLAGLLQDAFSPIPLGYSTFCFCAVGLTGAAFRGLVITEALPTHLLFGGAASAAVTLALWGLLAGSEAVAPPAHWGLLKTLGAGVLGMVTTPAVFAAAGRLDAIVGNVAEPAPEGEARGIRGPA